MQSLDQILLSQAGLAASEEVALITAVKLLTHDGKVFKIISENNSQAHLLVINVDKESGKNILENSREGQVKLLLSNQTQTGKNVISLKIPIEITTLKEILGKLFDKMQKQLSSARAQLPRKGGITSNTNQILTNTLFHLLLSVKENKEYVFVKTEGYPEILVDSKNKSIYTTATDDELTHIVKVPLNEFNIDKLKSSDINVEDRNRKIISLHDILWMSAISCSHGQLLVGHDIDQKVRLKAWPNFTRNEFRPSHLKLAAILAKRAVALSELETLTKVPYNEIVDFYNAAYSVDLIDKDISKTKNEIPERELSPKKKGLLSKIANRLGFGSQNLNIAGV